MRAIALLLLAVAVLAAPGPRIGATTLSPRSRKVDPPLQLRVLLAGCLAAAAGCATHQPDAASLPAQEYTGHLVRSDQESWFEPCSGAAGERWWVTWTDRSVTQIRTAVEAGRAAEGARLFVRLRAAPTDERLVGPGGPALLAREIHELRAAAPGDCAGG